MADWIGYLVSIKLVGGLGTYNGEIISVTPTTISLIRAFHNGIPQTTKEAVEISSSVIESLKLIERKMPSPQQNSTVVVKKPVAKKAGNRSQNTSESNNRVGNTSVPNRTKHMEEYKVQQNDTYFKMNNMNNKRDKNPKGKYSKGWRDEECFGAPTTEEITQDFDFESNLALFDKQALWEQLSNNQKPDIIKQAESKRPTNYRHDQNIITSGPVSYNQIQVPKNEFSGYVTDGGLAVPCISPSLRSKLFECAEKVGLTWDRRVELMGRAATEISIALMGGGHRLQPQNSHQWPTVVVLCGPNRPGATGINAARQLSSHGVRTIVYWVPTINKLVEKEMSLFKHTGSSIVTKVRDLPANCDLVILALCEESDMNKAYPDLVSWTNRNRSPIFAIDPPSKGTPNFHPKCSLVATLPLYYTTDNGNIYLCNLGLPESCFTEVGIKYKPPFGSKFYIPIHPKELDSP
ncbi:enhancer of mRNA-decapping protein 3 [Coccinella septempunctata]|uniref:enhancer of mRNA-decapping protein 3 n=1 Tax=Coccinella septempunctata TaxID=41139 RepID=UPI001D06F6CF|nr:enhancer of mRNA-decapping protein 3 [Coccinella septempunctata]